MQRVLADGGRWPGGHLAGTHAGPLETPGGTVPATGASVSVPATLWISVSGDEVAEVQHHLDVLTLLAQIGALPASSASRGGRPVARDPVGRHHPSSLVCASTTPHGPPRAKRRPSGDQATARAPRTQRTMERSDSRTSAITSYRPSRV